MTVRAVSPGTGRVRTGRVGAQGPGGGGGVSPAFQTNFTAISSLPAGVSYSRASADATMFDSTGNLTYAPNNLITNSNAPSTWIQDGGAGTVTTGVSDPDGGTSASTFTSSGANARLYNNVGSVANAYNVINSIWIRRRTGTGIITYWDPNNTPRDITSSVTSTWARVNSKSLSGTNIYNMLILATAGDAIDIYHAQTEYVTYETSPRTYNPTTSAAYYGPRFGYAFNGSVWVAAGLMDENQRTNLTLQSNNPSDAAWTKDSGGSINATNRPAPDGTNTASTFTTSSNGGRLYQSYVSTSGQPYSLSRWIRRRTGSGAVKIWNQSNVEVDITSQVSSVWNRINFTDTSSGTGFNMLILGTAGDEIDIYGAQTELGPFATSYIPTTSAAVTRSADITNITGSDFTGLYNQPANTFILEFTIEGFEAGGNQYPLGLSDGAGLSNFLGIRMTNITGLQIPNSTGAGVLTLAVPTVNVPTRIAFAQAANDHSASQDGGAAVTSTAVAAMPTLNRLDFNDLGGPSSIYKTSMWLRGFAAYKSRLPDATLQAKSVAGAAL